MFNPRLNSYISTKTTAFIPQAVKPNETVYEGIKFGTPLVFIADDFRTRINVYFVDERDTSLDTPYSMSFHNLASGDRGGSVPVELKHSTSGYIWIEGGQHVSHFTAERHPFTIYDNHKNEIFTVSIMPPAKEDL